MNERLRHYENSVILLTSPREVFAFVDNPLNLSKHMEKSKPQMLWGWMRNTPDEKGGREVGSVIRMKGNVLGINLSLEEVIIERIENKSKSWKTNWVNLLVIGNYTMGFNIDDSDGRSKLMVFIDYGLPDSFRTRWLGSLFGDMYAKWCVHQMLSDTQKHFQEKYN